MRFPSLDGDEKMTVVSADGRADWAADVCRVLQMANPTEAVRSLEVDEKTTLSNPEGRAEVGAQTFTLISESGLYTLIFKSRKPQARRIRCI